MAIGTNLNSFAKKDNHLTEQRGIGSITTPEPHAERVNGIINIRTGNHFTSQSEIGSLIQD
jgi:hypothetical protein